MGMSVGEAILFSANYCCKENLPLIVCSSSGGARMQEGILSLMQMPRTIIAINSLKEKKNSFYLSINRSNNWWSFSFICNAGRYNSC